MQNEQNAPAADDTVHEPPTITRLGTLSELTLGEGENTDDVMGGVNGDMGSGL
jgi:hypothetical protein